MSSQSVDVDGEVTKLAMEIGDLEDAIHEQESENRLLQAWQEYQSPKDVAEDGEDVLIARIQDMKHQFVCLLTRSCDLVDSRSTLEVKDIHIETLTEIKGVVMTGVKTDIVRQEKLFLRKKKQVEGNCGDIEFQINMNIEESMDLDSTIHSKITHLTISASETMYRDLRGTVEQLANEGNVQGFLTLLRPYNMWYKDRQKTYKHFATTFPKIVEQHSPQVLKLSHRVKECSFEIVWKFRVTDIYSVVPDIQLMVHVPNKVQNPHQDILKMVPERFQLMLKELGIENTLNTLVVLLQT